MKFLAWWYSDTTRSTTSRNYGKKKMLAFPKTGHEGRDEKRRREREAESDRRAALCPGLLSCSVVRCWMSFSPCAPPLCRCSWELRAESEEGPEWRCLSPLSWVCCSGRTSPIDGDKRWGQRIYITFWFPRRFSICFH